MGGANLIRVGGFLVAIGMQADDGVIDFLESGLHRFTVIGQGFLLCCRRLIDPRAGASGIKDRHGQTQGGRPDAGSAREQVGERHAFAAQGAGEADCRVIGRLGNANAGIGGDQLFFGLTNIRARFQ